MIEEIPEIISPDYQAVYAALARRVAAAYAFALTQNFCDSKDELAAAMQVIDAVENPVMFIKSISPTSEKD
jgi:5,10-methylenetetrahydrofolate reductase